VVRAIEMTDTPVGGTFVADDAERATLQGASGGEVVREESAPGPPADGGRRGLNRAQMAVLCFAAAVLVGMVLFPPWRARDIVRNVYCPGGYAALWAPPDGWESETTTARGRLTSGIDAYRLVAQIVGLCGATAVALLVLGAVHTNTGIAKKRVSGVLPKSKSTGVLIGNAAAQPKRERVAPWDRPGIMGWLSRPAPPRIGGWLGVWSVVLGIGVIARIVLVLSMSRSMPGPIMLAILQCAAVAALWTKQRWFPGYMAGLLCIDIMLSLLCVPGPVFAVSPGGAISPAINIAWCAVWIRYFLFSERVALTFHPDART